MRLTKESPREELSGSYAEQPGLSGIYLLPPPGKVDDGLHGKGIQTQRDRTCPTRAGLPWQERPLTPAEGIGDTGIAQIGVTLKLPTDFVN